ATTWGDTNSASEGIYKQLYSFSKECFSNPTASSSMEKPPPLDHILYDLNSISEEDLIHTICKKAVEPVEHPLAHLATMASLLLHGWGKSLGLPPFAVVELAGCGLAHPLTIVHS